MTGFYFGFILEHADFREVLYAAHTDAFIGGGSAVDRIILKNALLKLWNDEKAAYYCLNGGEFADRPYALLKDHFRTDLYELMGGGDIASLAAYDRWEEFFFENDYDEMLRFTFLNADGEAACTDEEAKTLAAFLERMSYVHVRAAAWAVLIAASGSSEYFTSEMAMRILSKREGVMEEYKKLLLETLGDELDDEQIDAYFRTPFIWAAKETLKKSAD